MTPLYEKVNYKSGLEYVFSRFIREYDIQKANISILFQNGHIDKQTYDRLWNASREERQREIGILQLKDPRFKKYLSDGIIQAKKQFFESNNIQQHEVLCIKNDAVFLIDKIPTYTSFGNVNFILKNTFTSFMSIFGVEVYYGFNRISNDEFVSIKGLGKNGNLHREYMTDFILYILNSMETDSIDNVIYVFNQFYNQYINMELAIGYYREYNSDSKIAICNSIYKVSVISEFDKNCIDITYNANVLRCIYGYLTSVYISMKNKK